MSRKTELTENDLIKDLEELNTLIKQIRETSIKQESKKELFIHLFLLQEEIDEKLKTIEELRYNDLSREYVKSTLFYD